MKDDGGFCSPPLSPDLYCLRFAGILQKPSRPSSQTTSPALQQRIFDFVHPNAQNVTEAAFFELQIGQSLNNVEVRIPRPIWHTVRGKLTGALPNDLANIYVHFSRDVGMIDDFASLGVKVDSLGIFEGPAQPGRYKLFVLEMAPPNERGITHMTRKLVLPRYQLVLVTLMGLKSSYGRAADGGSQGRLFILDLARCTRSFNVDAFGGDCPTGRVVR